MAPAAEGLFRDELHKRLSIPVRLRTAEVVGIVLAVDIADVRGVYFVRRKPSLLLRSMTFRPPLPSQNEIASSLLFRTH